MKSQAENSPRVAAHKQRAAEESLITKKQVIQNLERQLRVSKIAFNDMYQNADEYHKELMNLRKEKEVSDRVKTELKTFIALPWYKKLWLAFKELFGHKTKILQG